MRNLAFIIGRCIERPHRTVLVHPYTISISVLLLITATLTITFGSSGKETLNEVYREKQSFDMLVTATKQWTEHIDENTPLILEGQDGNVIFQANEQPSFTLLEIDLPLTGSNTTLLDSKGHLKEEMALAAIVDAVTSKADIQKEVLKSLISNKRESIFAAMAKDTDASKSLENKVLDKNGSRTRESAVIEEVVLQELQEDDNVQGALADVVDTEVSSILDSMVTQEIEDAVLEAIVATSTGSGSGLENQEKILTAISDQSSTLKELAENHIENAVEHNKEARNVIVETVIVEQLDDNQAEGITEKKPIITVMLRDNNGMEIPVPFHFKQGSVVLVIEPIRRFRPGLYTLLVTIINPITGQEQILTQDFSWGVLAMNTNADRYEIGDKAHIAFGVLDDSGEIVCDANLALLVTAPDGTQQLLSTEDSSIITTETCGLKEAGLLSPDFETSLTLSQSGFYTFNLTASREGLDDRSISAQVQVGNTASFTILRKAATRLWPFAPSTMEVTVEFHEPFAGSITDTVPGGFKILETEPKAKISDEIGGSGTLLTWKGKWKADDSVTLSYIYDAPDISPEFYIVGPLLLDGPAVGDGQYEQRAWQIANDAAGDIKVWDGGGGVDTNWSTAVNWSSDSVLASGEIAVFDGTSDNNAILDSSFTANIGGLRVGPNYDGTITLGAPLSISGSLIMSGGTLDVSASNYDINVTGDWQQYGASTFTARSGTVYMTGTGDTLTLSGSSAFNNLTLDSGLVGYWKFDEGTGTVAKDSSRFGNDGTLTNMDGSTDWVTTNTGTTTFYNPYALDFDGVDDYVDLGSPASLNINNKMSFSGWFKANGDYTTNQAVIGNSATNGSTSNYGVTFGYTANKFEFWNASGGPNIVSTLSISDDNWRHYAATRAGSTSDWTLKLYIDGVLDKTETAVGTNPSLVGNAGVAIGRFGGYVPAYKVLGKLDDVRIYNRALAASEITALANGSSGGGSGRYVLGAALDINGDLGLYDSTLDVSASNYGINLAGNLMNSGDFTKQSGTVTLDGTSQTLSGSTVFNNLSKTVASADTLSFDWTARQSASGTLTLNGAASNLLSLRSTNTGSGWNVLLDGDAGVQSISYLDVKDSIASGGAELAAGGTSTDSGNNTNWTFVTVVPTVTITGSAYSDEGFTPLASKTVALSVSGSTVNVTAETDAGGQYTITATGATLSGSVLTLFLDNETENAVTVTISSGSTMTGVHLYQDNLIIKHETGGILQSSHLDTANNSGDSDITAVYNTSSNNVTSVNGMKLFVWTGSTFLMEGRLDVGTSGNTSAIHLDGSLTQGDNEIDIEGTYTQSGGTFIGSSSSSVDMYVNAHFITAEAAQFTAPAGDLFIGCNANCHVASNFTQSGSFTHNSGTVYFQPTYTGLMNIWNGSGSYNSIHFRGYGGRSAGNYDVANPMTVLGDITFGNISYKTTIIGSTINVAGDVYVTDQSWAECNNAAPSSGSLGSATVTFNGTGNQTLSSSAAGCLPNVTVDKAGGTLTLSGSVYIGGHWTFTRGGLNSGTSTLTFRQPYNTGKTIVTGTGTYNNVTFFINNSAINSGREQTISGYMNIAGSLSFDGHPTYHRNHLKGGTLDVKGNITLDDADATHIGTTNLVLTGTGTQSITTISDGEYIGKNIHIAKPSGTVTLISALSLNESGQDLTLTGGTLDLNGYDLTVNDQFIVGSGTTLRLTGEETVTGGPDIVYPTSTVWYDDSAGTNTMLNVPYGNLIIGSTGSAVFDLPSSITLSGALTISGGTLDATASNFDITVSSGSWLETGGAFTARSGTVFLSGTADNLTLSGSSAFNNLTLDSGLVGYWKLDEGTGTNAKDSSRNGNDGTLTNMTGDDWVTDTGSGDTTNFYNPYALDFDGSDDYVQIAGASAGPLHDIGTGDFTVGIWATNTATSGYREMIANWATTGMLFGRDAGGKLHAYVGDNNGNVATINYTITTDGSWHHYFITRSSGTVQVYIDGSAQGSSFTEAGSLSATTNTRLGSRGNTVDEIWKGNLDDVRIYNRALDSSEVAALANGSSGGGSGRYVLGAALDVNGDLGLYDSTLDVSTSNYALNLAGNLMNSGDFTKQSGTFTLDGTSQTLSGSTVFNNLTKTVASADTLSFDWTARQSASGTLTLNGASANLLSLRSTNTGSGWNVLLDGDAGSQTLLYLDVKDSIASGGAALAAGLTSTDSGNNTNWTFGRTAAVWDAGGADNNWSTAANWNIDTVPTANEIVIFDATGQSDSTIDSSFVTTISGLKLGAAFTGTVTLGVPLGISGSLVLSGGTLDVSASNYDLNVTGDFDQRAAATFTARSGTVYMTGTGDTLTLSGSSAFNNLTLDSGLVGYWKLDEGTGTNAKDSSRNGNDGTLTNMDGSTDWVTTNTGTTTFYNPYALDFDGTDDYVDVNALPTTQVDNWAMSAWIYPRDNSTNRQAGVYLGDADTDGYGIMVSGNTAGRISVLHGAIAWNDSNTSYTQDAWQNITAVRNGGTLTLYKDGTALTPTFTNTPVTPTVELRIGDDISANSNANALIDDVRIYNRALSASEVAAIAAGSAGGGSGRYVLGAALDVNGDLGLYDSTLDVSTSNYALNLAGNLMNSGDFTKRSGTVTLDGTSQTLSGSTVFNNLSKTVASADTLSFDWTARQSASGTLTLNGAASNLLSLRSTNTGSGWNVLLDGDAGGQSLSNLDVKDSDASGGTALTCTDCTDSGNNTNWTFTSASTSGGGAAANNALSLRIRTAGSADSGITAIPITVSTISEGTTEYTSDPIETSGTITTTSEPLAAAAPTEREARAAMIKKVREILKDVELEPVELEKLSRIAEIEEKEEALEQELTETKEVRIEELQKEIEEIVYSNPLLQIRNTIKAAQNIVISTSKNGIQYISAIQKIGTDTVSRAIAAVSRTSDSIEHAATAIVDQSIAGMQYAVRNTADSIAYGVRVMITPVQNIGLALRDTGKYTRDTSIALLYKAMENTPRLENISKNIAHRTSQGTYIALQTVQTTFGNTKDYLAKKTHQSIQQTGNAIDTSIAVLNSYQKKNALKREEMIAMTAQKFKNAGIILGNNIKGATKRSAKIANTTLEVVGDGVHTATNSIARSSIALKDTVHRTSNRAKENAKYIAWQVEQETLKPSAPKPELPEPKVYRTQMERVNGSFFIATLHMSIFDDIGNPMRNTPVVLFSEPKVSVTDNEGTATFHNVKTGKHTLKIQIDDVTIKEQTITIEPPSGITLEELEDIDVILPVMHILIDEPSHGAAPSARGWAFIALIASIILGNAAMGYYAIFNIWKKRGK